MTNFLLDKEIFCDQVIRNQETMFRTAKAILRQDEDAEDAVQEQSVQRVTQDEEIALAGG